MRSRLAAVSVETPVAASPFASAARLFEIRRAVPAAVGVVLVLPSIVWAFLDRGIWPWDPAWYGEVSVDLWATLRTDRAHWWGAMTHAFGTKPPGVAWLGQFFVPFGGLVGGDSTALLLSVLLAQAATIALVFAACRRLGLSDPAAAVGALVVAASPLFVSMSHEYFAEPIQTFSIGWGLFVLASATRWPFALTAAQILGVASLALISKLSSPTYLGLPLAAAVLLAVIGPPGGRAAVGVWWRDRRVVASAVVSAILLFGAIAWYRVNLHTALEFARTASANTGLYGINQGFAHELPVWIRHFRDISFLPHVWIPIVVLVLASLALLVRRRGFRPVVDPRLVVAASCIVTIAIVITLFASQANQEVRYLVGLVPCLALVIAIAVDASGSRAIVAATALVLAADFGLTQLQSFGQVPIRSLSYPGLVAPASKTTFANALDEVVKETCTKDSAGKINMVGADYPWLNHNTLEMLAFERYAISGRRCYYTALGYAEKDTNAAWARLQGFQSPYYISIDYRDPTNPLPAALRSLVISSDPFNVVNTAIYRRVRASGSWRPLSGSRNAGLIVLRAVGNGT
jgi:hypothetical protein